MAEPQEEFLSSSELVSEPEGAWSPLQNDTIPPVSGERERSSSGLPLEPLLGKLDGHEGSGEYLGLRLTEEADAVTASKDNGSEAAPGTDPELHWLQNVYQGDAPQLTWRAVITGSLLGAVMALSNLYVGLKTGWGLGVAITACILSFALYSTLARIAPKFFGNNLTVLENNAMQSTASSAGYSTGTALVSAISALLMIQGHHVPAPALMGWVFLLAVMGTVIAIPLKRQMINIEQLRFPSGVAAAETLRSLYASGESAAKKAKTLFGAMGLGALVAWLRDAHAAAATGILAWLTKLSVIPATIPVPGLLIRGIPAARYTIAFEGSFILMAAGALIGLRTTATMAVASLLNYGVLAPWAKEQGAIKDLGFRGIVSWSLWIGASIMVSSGLLSFAFQWRTVSRAFKDLAKVFRPTNEGEKDPLAAVEVPGSWFLIGVGVTTVGIVALGAGAFGIHPALGVLAVLLSFVLAIVACRATGETDVTPIGALGKVTQLTYGVLAPSNVVTNITTASITASVASSSADLLTDLKSGYLLGANPRKQFLAQLAGTVVGTLVAVPAFYKLVPGPEALGTDRFPAPSAQVWKGVAELLSNGVESLHPTARAGMLVGLAVGIVITLLEQAFPKYKPYMPSAMGMGLAFVIPAFNSISMLIGSLIAVGFAKVRPQLAEEYTTPVAAGLIAGESLLGVAVALMAAAGWLQ